MRMYHAMLNEQLHSFTSASERNDFITKHPQAVSKNVYCYAKLNDEPWVFWTIDDRNTFFHKHPEAVKINPQEAWFNQTHLWALGFDSGVLRTMTRIELDENKKPKVCET